MASRVRWAAAHLTRLAIPGHLGAKPLKAQLPDLIAHALEKALRKDPLANRALRTGDSLSIRADGDRRQVEQALSGCRGLPVEQRHSPRLLDAAGKLELASGDFAAAQRDFRTTVRLAPTD